MTHDQATQRLPDLLADRDQPELLAHLAVCHECQRQLFLLGRVDRMLRELANAEHKLVRRRRWSRLLRLSSVLAAAVAVPVCVFVLVLPTPPASTALTLRTLSGRVVGRARLALADRHNVSVLLTARGLPIPRSGVYLLWALDSKHETMPVGRFMVGAGGSCHARFNLPGSERWTKLWVTSPGHSTTIVATS